MSYDPKPEHKFTFGLWTVGSPGRDPFGLPTRDVPGPVGLVHLLATDAHDARARPPRLDEGRDAAARRVGEEEARRLVLDRPRAIVDDRPASEVPMPERTQRKGTAGGFRNFLKTVIGVR